VGVVVFLERFEFGFECGQIITRRMAGAGPQHPNNQDRSCKRRELRHKSPRRIRRSGGGAAVMRAAGNN
jgi:hypothetical protein